MPAQKENNVQPIVAKDADPVVVLDGTKVIVSDEKVDLNPKTVIADTSVTSQPVVPENKLVEEMTVVTEDSSASKWIVLIVVLLLLIIALAGGAFYYFTQYKYQPQRQIISPEIEMGEIVVSETEENNLTNQLEVVGTADDVDAITVDVNNTDLDSLDSEMEEISKEL